MNENELKKEYNNFLQDLNLKSCKKSKNIFIYYFLKNEYDFHNLDIRESEKIQKEIIKILKEV